MLGLYVQGSEKVCFVSSDLEILGLDVLEKSGLLGSSRNCELVWLLRKKRFIHMSMNVECVLYSER